jgi:hypothetical protein
MSIKAGMIHAAEVFDTWRIVPRLILAAYGAFVYKVTFEVLHWYFVQPAIDRGLEESGVVAAVFTAVTGFAPWIFRIYMNTGRDWSANPAKGQGETP